MKFIQITNIQRYRPWALSSQWEHSLSYSVGIEYIFSHAFTEQWSISWHNFYFNMIA